MESPTVTLQRYIIYSAKLKSSVPFCDAAGMYREKNPVTVMTSRLKMDKTVVMMK